MPSSLTQMETRIREILENTFLAACEIGDLLAQVKSLTGQAEFLEWCDKQFGWSRTSAENYIRLSVWWSKNKNRFVGFDTALIEQSAGYILSRPTTPKEIVDEVIRQAKTGTQITHRYVDSLVKELKKAKKQQEQLAEAEDKHERGVQRCPICDGEFPADVFEDSVYCYACRPSESDEEEDDAPFTAEKELPFVGELTDDDAKFNALVSLWKSASKEVQSRFLDEIGAKPKRTVKKNTSSENGKFVPPKPTEVREYADLKELKNVDANEFVDFYASKGWMVGKNKMKNWHAAASRWSRANTNADGSPSRKKKKVGI